ncbi:MAG: alpha/beta fold hydrolase [Acidimicrobiia bacterium]
MTIEGLPADATVIPIRIEGEAPPPAEADLDARSRRDRTHVLPRERARAALSSVLPEAETPVVGPESGGAAERGGVAAPRLARHVFRLADGHEVGVTVSGRGVPLVLVHGFTAEGFLYAQTLSRLVSMGFKVVAIDTANHGSTQGLPAGGANFGEYARLLGRTLDELGIERAFFAGHSMGGRVVTQLCAVEPDRAIGVILVDAIVGDTWDRMVNVGRLFPPAMAGVVVLLAVDAITTPPVLKNPEQALKLGRLLAPTLVGQVSRPWRLLGPAVSILRSRGSRWMLQRLAQEQIPVVAVHGTRDFAVPLQTAKDAARQAKGQFVVIEGANHCWPLRDPETLPAIVSDLLHGSFGEAYREAVRDRGLDPDLATLDDVEGAFYAADAPIRALTPRLEFARLTARRRRPAFRYDIKPALESTPVP